MNEKVRSFFQREKWYYQRLYHQGIQRYGRFKEIINEVLGCGEFALDVGCGSGVYALTLASLDMVTCGIDISPIGIQMAQQIGKELRLEDKASFFIQSADHFGFPDESFDVVYSVSLLEHLASHRIPKAISEMVRVCRLNGKIVILCMNYCRDQSCKVFTGLDGKMRNLNLLLRFIVDLVKSRLSGRIKIPTLMARIPQDEQDLIQLKRKHIDAVALSAVSTFHVERLLRNNGITRIQIRTVERKNAIKAWVVQHSWLQYLEGNTFVLAIKD